MNLPLYLAHAAWLWLLLGPPQAHAAVSSAPLAASEHAVAALAADVKAIAAGHPAKRHGIHPTASAALAVEYAALRQTNASPAPPSGPVNSITIANASAAAISNYPLQFGRPFVDGAIADQPQVLISGSPVTTQADVKNRYPDGSAEFAVIAVIVPTLPAGGSLTLTFRNQVVGTNTPLTQAEMLASSYMFSAQMILAAAGTTRSVDARKMLQNGDYKLWTQGPVAQTVILGDDTTARKYDIGFDGYRPFRPRFYATFWPATHQVFVRAVGENGLTSGIEDMTYNLTLTAANAKAYSKSNLTHWATSSWSRTFWLGKTPSPQVNIDNNLAYLASTRFLPHFDAATTIDPSAVASEYALWTGKPHDLYDGVWDGGLWENGMGTPGARQDIGPYPTWTTMWLYTGDWRLRQMALGMADLAASWPYHLRETDPTKPLLRTDAAPSGTGLGRPVSIVGRPTLVTWEGDLNYGTAAADMVDIVGPVSTANPWGFEGSHEPAAFYPQYVVTGDPWYLGEMEMWASWDAARYIVGNVTYGRGPDGSYGGVNDEVRGAGWVMRDRVEAAFAVPDGDPEKIYLGTLVNDALARWEGSFGVTGANGGGTAYDGSVMKNWGAATGDYWTWNLGPNAGKAPTLHYWESDGNPTTDNSLVDSDTAAGWFVPGAVGSITDLWMHWYSLYCLGRAAELGFAAGPFQEYTGQLLTGLINSSGLPTVIAAYEVPAEIAGGGFPATYPAWLALFTSSANSASNQFLTCSGTMPSGQLCLQDYFASNLYAQGRQAYAMAALAPLVDAGAAGAAQAWAWMDKNVRQPIAATTAGTPFAQDPSWDIVPRTDANVLPAQSAVLQ
jgi:hypothetical protein